MTVTSSTCGFTLEPLAQEGEGLIMQEIKGTWEEYCSGGANDYINNPTFDFSIEEPTHIQMRLKKIEEDEDYFLNVSLFTENGSHKIGKKREASS